jgi:hypothetical protein
MKQKLISTLLLTLFITCFSLVPAQAILTVSLDVLDSNIMVGENFDVEVWVDGDGIGDELLAFGFDVDTPETYFTYTGYTLESGFDDISDISNSYNVAGDVFSGISDDDVLLATLSFNATAEGSDDLTVFGKYDGTFYGLFYEASGFDIDATTNITIKPIPEPCTILLLSTGLPVIAAFRKRFGNG